MSSQGNLVELLAFFVYAEYADVPNVVDGHRRSYSQKCLDRHRPGHAQSQRQQVDAE